MGTIFHKVISALYGEVDKDNAKLEMEKLKAELEAARTRNKAAETRALGNDLATAASAALAQSILNEKLKSYADHTKPEAPKPVVGHMEMIKEEVLQLTEDEKKIMYEIKDELSKAQAMAEQAENKKVVFWNHIKARMPLDIRVSSDSFFIDEKSGKIFRHRVGNVAQETFNRITEK